METEKEHKIQWDADVICRAIIVISAVVAVFVRFYRLSEIPYGIHADEAGMGYDAWCMANYSIDRWLNKLPVYMTNYGGGQSALYAYLCEFLIKVTGGDVTLLLMRLPGAVLSVLAYFAGTDILRRTWNLRWAAAGSCLLAVLPYFIMQGRFGLDCNLLVSMLTISVCFFLLAKEKQRPALFFLAGVFWGLTYYTYALSYVANTVILIALTLYLLWTERSLWKNLVIMWIPVVLLGLPLGLMILINHFQLPEINLLFFTIPRLPDYRGGEFCFELKTILKNVGTVLSCILTRDSLDYNAFDRYYTMYRISVPFIIIGFFSLANQSICLVKKRVFRAETIWCIVFAAYFLTGICLGGNGANVNKLNGIFFAQFFMLLYGIKRVYGWLKKKWKNAGKGFLAVLSGIYAFSFLSFAGYYFTEYPQDIYPQYLFYDTYEDIYAKLQQDGKSDRDVYVDSNYMYYCLSSKVSPYDYNCVEYGTDSHLNYHFHLPDSYQPGAVYIVRETNQEYIDMIKEHTTERYREGMYICFYE